MLDQLTADLLIIFSEYWSPADIGNVKRVCRYVNEVLISDVVWYYQCQKFYHHYEIQATWLNTYKKYLSSIVLQTIIKTDIDVHFAVMGNGNCYTNLPGDELCYDIVDIYYDQRHINLYKFKAIGKILDITQSATYINVLTMNHEVYTVEHDKLNAYDSDKSIISFALQPNEYINKIRSAIFGDVAITNNHRVYFWIMVDNIKLGPKIIADNIDDVKLSDDEAVFIDVNGNIKSFDAIVLLTNLC